MDETLKILMEIKEDIAEIKAQNKSINAALYNEGGIQAKVADHDTRLARLETSRQTAWTIIAYIVTTAIAVLSIVLR